VTPRPVPAAPTSLAVTPGNASVSVAFTAGAANGSSISNYEYELNGSGNWFALSPAYGASPVSVPATNGVAYRVKLRAVNDDGSGGASAASDWFVPRTTPSAPTLVSATPADGSVSIEFTPGATGGAVITNYAYSTDDGANWTMRSPASTSSPLAITSLTNGTAYTIKLKAVNAAGDGAASDAVSVTPRTTPSAPTSLIATPGDGSVSIAFVAGADGGAAITKYQYSTNGGTSWSDTDAGTTSPVSMSGLTNYTTYSLMLRAVNSAGDGADSSAVSVTPAAVGPTQCSATALGRYQIQICWNALSPAQGSVTRYRAYVYTAGTSTKVASCKGSTTDVSCVVKGKNKITAATTYDVRARARIQFAPHQVLWSLYSSAVQVTTLQ